MSDYSTEASVTVNAIQGSMTGITALETGLVSINNQVQDIGRAITAQGNIMDTMLASVGVIAATGAVKAAEAFGNVEQSMKIVQMVSQQTSADIQYLTQQANQFSTQYRTDIDQITEGLQTLGRAGLNSASEQSEVLENGLQTAKLEGRELNSVLEELIQNTALLGGDLKSSKFGEQTDYINDLLISTSMSAPIDTHDVSETLKYSGGMLAAAGGDINTAEGKRLIEDYMGSVAAFAQKGVTGSIAGTALRAFFNKPATQDSSVLEGLSQLHLRPEYLWEDGGERMKPVSDQIALIQGQMDKLNISTMDQMQIWSKIVGGKMGQQMMKLNSSDIKDLTKDIQNSASAEELATKSMQTYESAVKEAQETAALAFRNFGEKVAKWLAPIVKIGTLILKIFAHPVGSYALFTGFLAILSKTVSIGIRYIRTFANDLKATLAGVNMLSNNIADKSAQANVSAAATASTAAAAQKVKETNKQQAQQKETVNRAAIERTAMLEKAKAAEIKSEINSNVNALHNDIQYKIDETAANIKTKISSAIKSSTNDLTYLAYNDKGKLKQDKGFDRGVNFSGVEPGTVVEPPIRTSTGFTAYRDSMTTSAEQYIATKMLDEEKEFEKGLAEIQQKKQRNIALNEIYHGPLQEQETIGFLEERMEKEKDALAHHQGSINRHGYIEKLALNDIIMRDNNIARAAAFNHSDFVYDPINEKRQVFNDEINRRLKTAGGKRDEQFLSGRIKNIIENKVDEVLEVSGYTAIRNGRPVSSQIPLFRTSNNKDGDNYIVDFSKMVQQNRERFEKLPQDVQRQLWKVLTAATPNSEGGFRSGLTSLIRKKYDPEMLAEVDSLRQNFSLVDAIRDPAARAKEYNSAIKYIENTQGEAKGFQLMFDTEKAVLPTKKDAVAITQEEIDYREKGIAKRNKDLKTLFTNLNESDKQISELATLGYSSTGLSDLAASGFDAFGRPTTPTHARIRNKPPKFMDLPEVGVSDTGFINTPTMGNQISIKQLRKGIEEYNRLLLGASDIGFINTPAKGNQISIKQFEKNIDAYNESLRRGIERLQYADPISRGATAQRAYLKDKYQDKFSLSDRLFKQNTIPMTDVFIRKQIQGLTLVNAAANEFVQTAKEAAALSKAQRKGKYYNEHPEHIGRKDSVITDPERPFSRAAMTKNRQSTEDFVREEEKKRKTHYNYLTEARNNVVADNQRAQAALKKLGYEKEITRELREQDRILNAQEAKERQPGKQTKDGVLNRIFGSDKDKDKGSTNNQFKDMAQQIEEQRKERENFMNRLPKGYSDSRKETEWNNRDLFKSEGIGTKISNWFKNGLGLGSGGGLEKFGKSLKSAGSSLVSFIAEGINPVTFAMGALTFIIDQISAAHENYVKELGDIQKNLQDAISKRNTIEQGLKQAYTSEHPDADSEEQDNFILAVYDKIEEQGKDINTFLNRFATYNKNDLPKYTEDEEGNIVKDETEPEEETEVQSVAAGMQELLYVNAEIRQQMGLLTSKMNDPIWGINGLATTISKGFEDILESLSFGKGDSGEYMYSGQLQGKENDLYNNDLASQIVANMESNPYFYDEEGRTSNEDMLQMWNSSPNLFRGFDFGLSSILGKKTAQSLIQNFSTDAMSMVNYGRTMSGWSQEDRSTILTSWKEDGPLWSQLAKETAKETRRQTRNMTKEQRKNAKIDFKNAKKTNALINKIQQTTGKNLSKQTILEAQSMVQLKDIQELADNTIRPLQESQAQSGLQTAMSALYLNNQANSSLSMQNSLDTNVQLCAAYLAVCAQAAAFQVGFYQAKADGTTGAHNVDEFVQEMYQGYKINDWGAAIDHFFSGDQGVAQRDNTLKGFANTINGFTNQLGLGNIIDVNQRFKDTMDIQNNRGLVTGAMTEMAFKARYPNLSEDQLTKAIQQYSKNVANGTWNFGDTMSKLSHIAQKGYAELLDKGYFASDIGEGDDSGSGSGGSGSGGGGSGSSGSGDKSGTKKDRVDLVLCSKKQIPKLDVNLFKKAPQFTILNKNFRLRDIKISTKDKPKAVLDSIKNAIIDTQQRMDPKIIQDEDAEYNPAEATDGKSLPAGSTNTSTK